MLRKHYHQLFTLVFIHPISIWGALPQQTRRSTALYQTVPVDRRPWPSMAVVAAALLMHYKPHVPPPPLYCLLLLLLLLLLLTPAVAGPAADGVSHLPHEGQWLGTKRLGVAHCMFPTAAAAAAFSRAVRVSRL